MDRAPGQENLSQSQQRDMVLEWVAAAFTPPTAKEEKGIMGLGVRALLGDIQGWDDTGVGGRLCATR